MKYLIIILSLLFSSEMYSQGEANFLKAVSSVDMTVVENYMAGRVELSIFDNRQMLSKSAASRQLGGFLRDNQVKHVEIIHQGSSRDKTSNFKVAKLITQKGVYRLFLYFADTLGTDTVKEIRIDKF